MVFLAGAAATFVVDGLRGGVFVVSGFRAVFFCFIALSAPVKLAILSRSVALAFGDLGPLLCT